MSPDKQKEGGLCFGFCCDFRRATIIVNAIIIVVSVITILGVLGAFSFKREFINVDDDEVQDIWDDAISKKAGIYAGISIAFSICAVVGAVQFNLYLVLANILWIAIQTLLDCLNIVDAADKVNDAIDDTTLHTTGNIVAGIVMGALFIYPHAALCKEMKEGIMTPETYPREEHSCCCV